jgi:hypothetical protein
MGEYSLGVFPSLLIDGGLLLLISTTHKRRRARATPL